MGVDSTEADHLGCTGHQLSGSRAKMAMDIRIRGVMDVGVMAEEHKGLWGLMEVGNKGCVPSICHCSSLWN